MAINIEKMTPLEKWEYLKNKIDNHLNDIDTYVVLHALHEDIEDIKYMEAEKRKLIEIVGQISNLSLLDTELKVVEDTLAVTELAQQALTGETK